MYHTDYKIHDYLIHAVNKAEILYNNLLKKHI
jgi:hypothetical protein